jgi:hypothetical protein
MQNRQSLPAFSSPNTAKTSDIRAISTQPDLFPKMAEGHRAHLGICRGSPVTPPGLLLPIARPPVQRACCCFLSPLPACRTAYELLRHCQLLAHRSIFRRSTTPGARYPECSETQRTMILTQRTPSIPTRYAQAPTGAVRQPKMLILMWSAGYRINSHLYDPNPHSPYVNASNLGSGFPVRQSRRMTRAYPSLDLPPCLPHPVRRGCEV